METEIEWKEVEAKDPWKVWDKIPICSSSSYAAKHASQDITQITKKGITIDIGYVYRTNLFICRVIQNYRWEHPLEKTYFDHGQQAYDWAIKMMDKYG